MSAAARCYRGVKNQSRGKKNWDFLPKSHICLSSAAFPPRLLQPTKFPRLISHSEQFGKQNLTPSQSNLMTLESWIWLLHGGSGNVWSILKKPFPNYYYYYYFILGDISGCGAHPGALSSPKPRPGGSNLSYFLHQGCGKLQSLSSIDRGFRVLFPPPQNLIYPK